MKIGTQKAIVARIIISFFTSAYAAFLNTLMKQEFLSGHFFVNWLNLVPKIYLLLLPFVLIMGPVVEILVDKIFRIGIEKNKNSKKKKLKKMKKNHMPTDTIVKAAAVQISPVLYSREGTIEKIIKKIRELGKQGVQFATFPETVVPYYPYFSFILTPSQIIISGENLKLLDQAVTVPSAATDAIGQACKDAGVVVSVGVNERDGGTMYNTQLLFDADGTLIQRRRKITPTYNERMLWGQGDGSGLHAVDSKVGRIGQLACWEHYNPLARYAMMADGEQIHSAMYPGSIFGDLFTQQTEVNIRQHALESACFVVCATAWLDPDQQEQIAKDTGGNIGPIAGGCFTAIVAPDGTILGEPIRSVKVLLLQTSTSR
jgi:aliphatic nitrilase